MMKLFPFVLALLPPSLAFVFVGLNISTALADQIHRIERTCREMHLNRSTIFSKVAIEEFIIAEVKANIEEFGILDWDCIIREFESQGNNTTVWVIPEGGLEGADLLRFTLDRSNNLLAAMLSFGAGNSNGVFTGIFTVEPSGEVAVIRKGGKTQWLQLEYISNDTVY